MRKWEPVLAVWFPAPHLLNWKHWDQWYSYRDEQGGAPTVGTGGRGTAGTGAGTPGDITSAGAPRAGQRGGAEGVAGSMGEGKGG